MRRARIARLLLVGLAGSAVAFGVWRARGAASSEGGRAADLHGAAYVGSAACRRCHHDNYQSWAHTFHRTMTTDATPATVRGDFSGQTLRHGRVEARMDRDPDGGYRMTFTRAGEPPRTAKVVRAVGSRRYQQYLALEGDTYWRLPVAYHIEERRWFPMTRAFLFPDDAAIEDATRPSYGGDPVFDRHVTRWNDNCVFCHNVAPNPGLDPASGAFRTTVAELGIACEACHGPGGEHVRARAERSWWEALRARRADPTIVNPSRLPPVRAAEVCGRCHGQRITADIAPFLAHGDPFLPGDDLARYSRPLQRDTPLHGDANAFAARFWDDGTPRLTAYEFQGLLQSKCAQKGGLTCTTCHGMHEGDPRGQIRPRFAGAGAASDRMCTQCHGVLATSGALAAHSHHDPAGEGARCVGCHMPRIVYGVLDVHRSHRIDLPKPAPADVAAVATAARPDACTLCHVGGVPGGPAGVGPLRALFAAEPVGRAVAADALGRGASPAGDDRARRLGALLAAMETDRYPAVRHLAWRSLRRLYPPGAGLAVDYDPSAEADVRRAVVARVRGQLGAAVRAPDARAVAALAAAAPDRALEIGE